MKDDDSRTEQMFEEIRDELKSLREMLMHPDTGIYSRIRNVTTDVEELTAWKSKIESRVTMVIGALVTMSTGIVGKFIYDFLSSK